MAKATFSAFVLFCLLFSIGSRSAAIHPKVLFIIGEPLAFSWNQTLSTAIENAFKQEYPNGTLYFEYLDLPNLPPSMKPAMRQIVAEKYKSISLDALIFDMQSTYNMLEDAYPFRVDVPHIVLQYRNELQPNQRPNTYTLQIKTNYKEMVQQAIKIADAEQVVFVGKTNTQYAIMGLGTIKEELRNWISGAQISFVNFTTMADLEERSAAFPDSTVVVLAPFFVSDEKRIWAPSQLSEHIASNLDYPVFVHWETMLNNAVAGGINISPQAIAQEVLGAISDIVKQRTPYLDTNKIYNSQLNSKVSERFGLKLHGLPSRTDIYNKPASPFELFFNEIVIVSIVLSVLLFASAVLLSWNRVLKRQQIERYKSEKALTHAHERMRMAVSATQIGIWEYVVATQTLLWDDWMYLHHAQDKEVFQLNLQNWLNLIYEDDENEFETNLRFAINNGKQLSQEYRADTVYGIRYLSINTDIILDMDNKPVRLIGAVKDITKQTNYENRLKQERDRIMALSSAKANFVSSMSHELRTPISTIIGTTEFLRKAQLDKKDQDYIALLANSAQKLSHTVNDLLDISKLENGRMSIEKYGFNPLDLILKTVANQQILADKKQLHINVDIPDNLPKYLISDGLRIKQVLNNLFDNAIKFTDAGYIYLRVQFKVDKDLSNQGRLVFLIQDTGIGIPENANERIFETFCQSDINTFKKYGGTGLGLSISREIAHKLGGSLEVQSEPHRGSLFTFTIPVAVSSQGEYSEVTPPSNVPNLMGKRVLIVDDIETNRLIISHMLADTRVETSFAENGHDALEKFNTEKFDLVLMDVLMPVMDGLEAAKQIRKQDSSMNSKSVPIISITAQAFDDEEEICLAAGIDGYLAKPINQADLYSTIDRLVG